MSMDISIVDSLIISLVSMVAVFIVLAIILYLVDLLKIVANKKTEEPEEPKKPRIEQDLEDDELVAVIAAALAVNLGVSISKVKIRGIKRVPSTASRWAEVGRIEQITGKL